MPAGPPLPPWPDVPPASGPVVLRAFHATDLPMALDLSRDPYAPLIATMPAHASEARAADWIERQQRRIPQLHRVELYVEPWNTASVRTAENAGYEREGLLRSHGEIGGRRLDMLLFAAVRG